MLWYAAQHACFVFRRSRLQIVAPKPVNTTGAFVGVIIFCSKMPRYASDLAATVSFHTISSSVAYLQLVLPFDTLYSGQCNIFKHALNEYKHFYVSVFQDVSLIHLPNPTQHFQPLGCRNSV